MSGGAEVRFGGLTLPHVALIVVIDVLWGMNFVVAKIGVQAFPPVFFTAVRFFILFVMFAHLLRWHRGQMGAVAAIAMGAGAGHFTFMYLGLFAADSVAAVAIAVQLGVPFATILSVIFLGERIGWRRVTGLILAFCGVMVMGFDPKVLTYWHAVAMVALAALALAASTIFQRRLRGVGIFELQGWIAALSWPILLTVSLAIEDGQWASLEAAGWQAWGAVAYNVVAASIIGHGGIYYLLQRYEVSQTTPFTLLAPVFGALFGVWLLGHDLSVQMAAGGVLTLAGVLVIAVRQKALVPAIRTGSEP